MQSLCLDNLGRIREHLLCISPAVPQVAIATGRLHGSKQLYCIKALKSTKDVVQAKGQDLDISLVADGMSQ